MSVGEGLFVRSFVRSFARSRLITHPDRRVANALASKMQERDVAAIALKTRRRTKDQIDGRARRLEGMELVRRIGEELDERGEFDGRVWGEDLVGGGGGGRGGGKREERE